MEPAGCYDSRLSLVEGTVEVLAANRAYQDQLRALMKRLHQAEQRTIELQVLVKAVEDQVAAPPARGIVAPAIGTPGLPWFAHFNGKDLAPNPEGRARDKYLNTIRYRPWSAIEQGRLHSAVYDFVKRGLIELSIAAGLEINPAAYPVNAVLAQADNIELDWQQIAQGVPHRSAADCRIRWGQHDRPGLSRNRGWSVAETEQLHAAVDDHGKTNWAVIAAEVGGGRTVADCVKQYRNTIFAQHAFTPNEDARLKQLVEEHAMDWQKIARLMKLTAAQVRHRYDHSLLPTKTKGQFSEKEDALLRAAVNQHGVGNWAKVAEHIPGRTRSQCRERWADHLDPNLRSLAKWESWEDDLITNMKEQQNKSSAEIAHALGRGRTDLHVNKRYKDLKKAASRPSGSFAAIAREKKRQAEQAEQVRAARAAKGIVELGPGEAGPVGDGIEVGRVWYPVDLLQRLGEEELPVLPGLGAGTAAEQEREQRVVAATGEAADQPRPRKKAKRVPKRVAPAKKGAPVGPQLPTDDIQVDNLAAAGEGRPRPVDGGVMTGAGDAPSAAAGGSLELVVKEPRPRRTRREAR